jgi:hypothetical protein
MIGRHELRHRVSFLGAGTAEATATETVTRGLLGFAYAAFEPGVGVGTPLLAISMIAFGRAQHRSAAGWWNWRLALLSAGLLAAGALQVVFPPALVCGPSWLDHRYRLDHRHQRRPVAEPRAQRDRARAPAGLGPDLQSAW